MSVNMIDRLKNIKNLDIGGLQSLKEDLDDLINVYIRNIDIGVSTDLDRFVSSPDDYDVNYNFGDEICNSFETQLILPKLQNKEKIQFSTCKKKMGVSPPKEEYMNSHNRDIILSENDSYILLIIYEQKEDLNDDCGYKRIKKSLLAVFHKNDVKNDVLDIFKNTEEEEIKSNIEFDISDQVDNQITNANKILESLFP